MSSIQTSNLTDLVTSIENIYYDPASYTSDCDIPYSSTDPYMQIIKIFNTYLTYNITDDIIQQLEQTFIDIFSKVNMNLNFDNFADFIKTYSDLNIDKKHCSHYTSNKDLINELDKQDESQPYNIVKLMQVNQCKSCGCFSENHVPCYKFVDDDSDEYKCKTCGLGKHLHICCMDFYSSDKKCMSCGLDQYKHQDKLKENNIYPCSSFARMNATTDYCIHCKYDKTSHQLNLQLVRMNKKAYNKIIDLIFKFNVDNMIALNSGIINKDLMNRVNRIYIRNYSCIPNFSTTS